MNDIISKYESEFNAEGSHIKVDQMWKRYHGKQIPDRLSYAISFLYGSVIDVGAGDGYGAYCMLQNPKVDHISCIEIQDRALVKLRKNLHEETRCSVHKAIAEDLPFLDNSFDTSFCGQTLEHVYDDWKTVYEIYRVTKYIAVFSVPIKAGISKEHQREYTESSIRWLLERFFKVENTKLFTDENKIKRLVIQCRKV